MSPDPAATHVATAAPDLAHALADITDEIEGLTTTYRDELDRLHYERFNLVVDCIEAGMSRRAIAYELGVSHTTVQSILREGGLR